MPALLSMLAPLVLQYGPGIVTDILAAFQKAGYTVQQLDAIFSKVVPYDQLGINPNAPVLAAAPPVAPAPPTPTFAPLPA